MNDSRFTKLCFEAAEAAYADDSRAWSFSAVGCKVCITVLEEMVIIAFRGTSNLQNVLTDLQFRLVPYSPGQGKVHEGFFKTYQALEPSLKQILLQHRGKKMLFTGHSLGGGLATLAAPRFSEAQECITFGCPKVGDEDFARHYRSRVPKTARFINKFDPVPRLLHSEAMGSLKDDADFFHLMLGKVVKFPQSRLAGGEYVHVCDAVQLDTGAVSSAKHWSAFVASMAWMAGYQSDGKQQEAWRQALVPHDVSLYKQNLNKKQSPLGLNELKDLQLLLPIIRKCSSNTLLVTAAAATGLALVAMWRMQQARAQTTDEEQVRQWEAELRSAAAKTKSTPEDLPSCCRQLRIELQWDLETNGVTHEDLGERLEVLCHATFAAVQQAAMEGDASVDPLELLQQLAPLLGSFLWTSMSSPGQWLDLLPSLHHFHDLSVDVDTAATVALAWAPDDFEVRVTIAFTEKLRGKALPTAACEWFARYAELDPESPSCLGALDYDSSESMCRLIAVKTMPVFVKSWTAWPPTLVMDIMRCINGIAARDADKEVKMAAAESLTEVSSFVGLEPLLLCSQHEDPAVRRDAVSLLKNLWKHSDCGPCWVFEELRRCASTSGALCAAAGEMLQFLREESPEMVQLLEVSSESIASGSSMADAPPSFIAVD